MNYDYLNKPFDVLTDEERYFTPYKMYVYCNFCRQNADWISLKKCIDDFDPFGIDNECYHYYKQYLKILKLLDEKNYEGIHKNLLKIRYDMHQFSRIQIDDPKI